MDSALASARLLGSLLVLACAARTKKFFSWGICIVE